MYLSNIAIFVIIIAILLFIGLSVYSAFNSERRHQSPTGNDGHSTYSEINDERSLRLTNIKTVSFKTISSDIVVIPHAEEDLKVILSGKIQFPTSNVPKLIIDENRDKINIEVKYGEKHFFNIFNFPGFNELKLLVYLPESYTNNMEFATTSGDIDTSAFETLKVDVVTCSSVSGNFLAKNIDVSEMTLNTTSGDAKFNGTPAKIAFKTVSGNLKSDKLLTEKSVFQSTSGDFRIDSFRGDLEWNSVSGNLSIHYKDFDNDIKANTTSGNIQLKLPSDSAFKIDFSTISGSISIGDFPVNMTTQKRTHFQGSVKSGNNKINVHTTSGSLKIGYTSRD